MGSSKREGVPAHVNLSASSMLMIAMQYTSNPGMCKCAAWYNSLWSSESWNSVSDVIKEVQMTEKSILLSNTGWKISNFSQNRHFWALCLKLSLCRYEISLWWRNRIGSSTRDCSTFAWHQETVLIYNMVFDSKSLVSVMICILPRWQLIIFFWRRQTMLAISSEQSCYSIVIGST